MNIKGIWDKIKHPEKYGPEKVEEQKVSIEKVEQCHNCRHLQGTVCQMSKQVMKPNDSCSRWS